MQSTNAFRYTLTLFVLLSLAAICHAQTYLNRVWHYPPGSDPYYTIEDVTIGDSVWSAVGSPYVIEATVTVSAGATVVVQSGVQVQSAELGAIYVYGTLTADGATFTTYGSNANWRGIYFAPTAGASVISGCQILNSGGVGYCYYGCRGLGGFHGADRLAAIYIDDCNASITNSTISGMYGNAIEIWGGTPTITGNTISGVKPGYSAVLYDNTSIFPVISGNSASGTGSVGVSVPQGTISTSGRWTVAGESMPYLLGGYLTIAAGQTLIIDPGVTVKATHDVVGIQALGVLTANGTPEAPITFTTAKATPTQGDWIGIYIGPDSGASSLLNCRILYAGGVGYCYYGCRGHNIGNAMDKAAAVFVDGSSPTITSNLITKTYGHGIEVYNGSPNILFNSFSDLRAASYVFYLDTVNSFPVMTGNSLSGTGTPGTYSPGGQMTVSGTWNKAGAGLDWFLGSSLTLAADKALTIEPGNTLYMPVGDSGLYIHGTLAASGTVDAPVIFTSRAATPVKGDWNGIYLAPTSGNTQLANARILFAGGVGYCYYGCRGLGTYNGAVRYSGLYVDTCTPVLTGLVVEDTYGNGIDMYNSNTPLTGVAIRRASQNGLRLEGGSSPEVTNAEISNCGTSNYWAVSMDAACYPIPTGVSLTGNKLQGVEVRGGTMAASTTWKQWGSTTPYLVDGFVTVNPDVTFTIDPSVTVKLWAAGFIVNGTLLADGETGAINFTSMRDDTVIGDTDASTTAPAQGDWVGIYLSPGSGASILNNCKFAYTAGYNDGRGLINVHGEVRYAAVFVDGCSPTITNCSFKQTWRHAIELWASQAVIKNNVFTDLNSAGWAMVQRTTDTFPVYENNTVAGTGNLGVWLASGEIAASGRWYHPGPGMWYYMSQYLQVKDGATLTVDPGVTVRSASVLQVFGTLDAQGTAAQPITFTSHSDSAVGQWAGIYLGPTAGASALKWVNIRCASGYRDGNGLINVHGGVQYASLMLDTCSPPIDNITISKGWRDGLYLYASNSAVTNSLFTTHGYSGIVLAACTNPTMTGITTAGNDTGIYTSNSNFTLVNSIVSSNRLGINAGGTNNPVIRYSCVHTNRNANFTGIADPGTANGNIQQNPLFQNPTAGNYRLMNGSPCVDAGDDSVLTDGQLDLAGIARKQGTHVDMGAWEIPVAGAYSWSDVRDALRVAGGLLEPSPAQYTRLNVVSDSRVNLLDAVRLGRKVSGLEPNQ